METRSLVRMPAAQSQASEFCGLVLFTAMIGGAGYVFPVWCLFGILAVLLVVGPVEERQHARSGAPRIEPAEPVT